MEVRVKIRVPWPLRFGFYCVAIVPIQLTKAVGATLVLVAGGVVLAVLETVDYIKWHYHELTTGGFIEWRLEDLGEE